MQNGLEDLIKRASSGDSYAFEALVSRYDKKVLSIAMRYVKSEDDAQDIYQEVFIRVFKNLKNFEFKSEFSTWLYRITVNVCLNFIEKQKKNNALSIYENFGGDDDDDSFSFESTLKAKDLNPEENLSNKEKGELIKDAIETLSPKQKMVFTLKHFEELKIKEIAEIMDCTEGTVKRYLFDATGKLRIALQSII
ncbi:MAG: sigma-70 family RNA polymerase sigma factor [Ignavibacteriaceae bacterium]|nr:sigma-70 family RNA polymerase sigma factor [Ignavibacteriaceae bacterium]